MRKGLLLLPLLFMLGSLARLTALPLNAQASPPEKKVKREKFGSSLKRLKWDAKQHALIDTAKKDDSRSDSEEPIKLKTLLVEFDTLVVERATLRVINGLTKDDFIVTEDDQPQQVSTFMLSDDESLPRSIVLIIDWSASQIPYFDKSLAAARSLINRLGQRDEIAIVTDDVELMVDFTRDKARLNSELDSFAKRTKAGREPKNRKFQGRSRQFSALFATLREMASDPEKRPIIIFQTDGDEAPRFRDQVKIGLPSPNAPAYGLNDIYAAAEKSRATIYSVITNERLAGLDDDELYQRGRKMLEAINPNILNGPHAPPEQAIRLHMSNLAKGQMAMVEVANLTGGWAEYLEDPEDAQAIYAQILTDINQRYVIGYYPTNKNRDGGLRHVKIAVRDHPEYQTLGRKLYYAPSEQ
ncbi:MAG TPA: VWA domain-containing protein [Blastocatellia bacterium]|nr:VWA domain-containing protein [Blastocatellia bacterium]